MINTLQNSPEKVPSKGGNKFKKAIALAIALTLSGEPAEAKTYEKQEFPTEMAANIPGEYAPMTENVEQATVPNYINQAQNGVKKYYPQYEEYFRPIFSTIKGMSQNAKNIFNKKIHENFEIFDEELTTERDKISTILIAIDDILGEKTFLKGRKTIDSEDGEELLRGIANEITSDIKVQFSKELRESKEKLIRERERYNKADERYNKAEIISNKLKKIRENINNSGSNPEKLLKSIEELFEIIELKDINEKKDIQEIIKYYITIGKRINRNPSSLGKKFIEEYKRQQ